MPEPAHTIVSRTRPLLRLGVVAATAVVSLSLQGCLVGTAVGVTGAVVGGTAKATGAVIGAGVDAVTTSDEETRAQRKREEREWEREQRRCEERQRRGRDC